MLTLDIQTCQEKDSSSYWILSRCDIYTKTPTTTTTTTRYEL